VFLEVQQLNAWYGQSHILHGTSLHADSGGCVAILGRNGVGKTTLTRAIAGLMPRAEGSIRLDGAELRNQTADKRVKQGMALVPQGRAIFKSLTVAENLRVAGHGPRQRERFEDVLERFPGLARRREQLGGNLSGGEQQMLAIGRALMTEPRLLILDEPTEGLAPAIINDLRDQLLELKRTGLTILLTEQSLGFALAIADRAYVMTTRGEIAYHGTRDDLEANPEVMDRYLGITA
jgi:branched-chain amino acid transport system ATP-binding protein